MSPGAPSLSGSSPEGECDVRLNSDSLHDLTGPVNQIGTLAELLRKKHGGGLDSEGQELLTFLQDSAIRLEKLAAGLKTYVRVLGAPESRQMCNAEELLAAAKASLQPEIDRRGGVLTADRLPEIYGDAGQIQYLFSALIANAIQFRGPAKPEIHVSGKAEAQGCLISVQDNGCGIDPKHRERIFGTFQRIQGGAHAGAGVGLAIARQIVEQHGGRIWVESELGKGATFFFRLPSKVD
jgi:light-regulated signal transduction histidine kinase (bacteriophytochrome)